MNKNTCSILLATLLLQACAPASRDRAPTIRSLEDAPSVIIYEPQPRIDRQIVIAAYRALLSAHPGQALRHRVMRRIADLQLAIATDAVKQHRPGAGRQIDQAAKSYERLLQNFPHDPDADAIRYQLAHSYASAGRQDRSLAMLTQLLAANPGSPLRAESWFRRGEIRFARKEWTAAAHAYRQVVTQGEDTAYYVQARYKQGWALFSQGLYEQALDALLMLLDNKLAHGGRFVGKTSLRTLNREDQTLVQDTLRVINMSFSYLEEKRSINAYLTSRRQRPYDDLIYDALAQRYLSKERYTDAADTYAAFVELNPDHPEAPYFQVKVYETYQQAGFRALAWTARQDLIDRYGFNSPFWKNHDSKQYPQIVAALKQALTELAQHYHALAQASGKAKDFTLVGQMYRNYLALFPADPQAPRLRYLLAELLYQTGHYQQAIKEYEQTAYGYRKHGQAAEAGYTALLATQKYAIAAAPPAEQKRWREKAIDSALRFSTHFPDHPQATAVLTRTAETLFARKDYRRALMLAKRVIQHEPPAAAALRRTAWTIQGHIAFDRQDYLQAANNYSAALQLSTPQDPQRAILQERLSATLYKQGEGARQQGKTTAMIDYFLRIPRIAPGNPIASSAEYDAAAGLIALKQWPRAIEVLKLFLQNFPAHPLRQEAVRKLAYAYLQNRDPAQAAAQYLQLGEETTDRQLKKESWWQAAQLYDQAGLRDAAIIAYQRYVSAFPTPIDQAQRTRQRLVELTGAAQSPQQQHYWQRQIISADEAVENPSAYSHQLAAHVALALAEPARVSYQEIPLATPLKISLAAKKQALQTVVKAYGKAMDYHLADVSTTATYYLGEIYYDLSRSLLNSERPAGLSSTEREQYDILLEEEAYPFEEQAIKLHEANVRHIQSGIYNQWIRASLKQLAELLPAHYAKNERRVTFVENID